MRIWIDLGNSPHVPFFLALSREFESRGHEIVWTARDYAQTVELAVAAGIDATVFGTHGGKHLISKAGKFFWRVCELAAWAAAKKIDLTVSHNSQEPLAVARLLGFRSVNLMDYEHHPGNHMSFRMAKRLVVPSSFPDAALQRFKVAPEKVSRFTGIKEDVYLADFEPADDFSDKLADLGITSENVLIVVRPHAPEALYHRGVANELLSAALDKFSRTPGCKIILLPRKAYQGEELLRDHLNAEIIIPERVLDGANLIAAADLVISGGGTMNREAAALGVPTATIFAGESAAIDEYLINEGRMKKIETIDDLDAIEIVKKQTRMPRREASVRRQVADLILEETLPNR